jgi:hypothetical protein
VLQRTAVDAQHDRPLPRPDRLDRAEGNSTPTSQEQAASTNDDFVGMISVPLIADVIEPTELRAVARHHPVPLGSGKQAPEFRPPPHALLITLIPDRLPHDTQA